MNKPEVEVSDIDFGRSVRCSATFDMTYLSQDMFINAMQQAARLIAEKYVAENYSKIVEHIDQKAIANLAIANAGAEISKTLKEEAAVKTKIVEHVKTQFFQRGIFGGLTKL